jgi:HAD superfamily hydrolase (TIGR01549 family)
MGATQYVFLDAAGTLLHKPGVTSAFQETLRSLGIEVPDDVVIAVHKRLTEATIFPEETSSTFYEGFNSQVLRALGAEPAADDLEALWSACAGLPWEAYDDVLELQRLSVPFGIISNWDKHLRATLATTLPLQFQHIFSSAETGFEKPDVRLFTAALDVVGLQPDRVAFIGDSPRLDIEPASSAGMRSVLLDRLDTFPKHQGDRVKSLTEFVDSIGRELAQVP